MNTRMLFKTIALLGSVGGLMVGANAMAETPASSTTASCPALLNHQFPRLQDEAQQNVCQYAGKAVLVANDTDVEGDATSYYLSKRFASGELRVTRIAQGIQAGSGLEYADEVTLSRALEGRRALE